MLKVLEMFSGYGGASFALKKLGVEHEVVGFSEIDKYAIQCYNQNHKKTTDLGDCTRIDPGSLPDFDLLTAGFPCQPFSTAGKGLGEQDIRGTLFHDIIRIAEEKQPQYMLLENVRGIITKRHKETFEKIVSELKRIGYHLHIQLLNSRDYGTPQKRERVYFICFKEKAEFDAFVFPQKTDLEHKANDLLLHGISDREDILCLTANYFKGNNLPGYLEKSRKQIVFADSIIVPNATKLGYKFAEIGNFVLMDCPTSKTNRGRVQTEVLPTITTSANISVVEKDGKKGIYFRMLTGKECFRFMGFFNDEINLKNLSERQQKKLAGNGWDINMVSKIFKEMKLQ